MSRNLETCQPGAGSFGAILAALLAATALTGFGCADAEDRSSTWSFVYPAIIQPNCTTSNCHVKPASTAGLQFETRAGAYTYLTGLPCETAMELDPGLEPDHNFVVPGDPERSKVIRMMRGEEVRSMPPDIPLPDVEIEIVENWILEGAKCD